MVVSSSSPVLVDIDSVISQVRASVLCAFTTSLFHGHAQDGRDLTRAFSCRVPDDFAMHTVLGMALFGHTLGCRSPRWNEVYAGRVDSSVAAGINKTAL